MILVSSCAPALEPITLAEAKSHLRIDSVSFGDYLSESYSIHPGTYSTGTSTGTGVDVLGYSAMVLLETGTFNAGGKVDAHIEESDDDTTYTDWTGGTFTQITTSGYETVYEKAYTGTKQYIRVVAYTSGADCDFGVTVVKGAPQTIDDTLIASLITAAREYAESVTHRALITQTWVYYLEDWPSEDHIDIPLPPLQSVSSIKYTDYNGTETTWSTDDWMTDTGSEPGRVILGYGESWPTATLYPLNPIAISFTAGYGSTYSSVPRMIRQGMLVDLADLYENRESIVVGQSVEHLPTVERLYSPCKIWDWNI